MQVEWTSHPARRRPKDVALLAMVGFVFCGAVLGSLQSAWLAALAAIVIVVATAPFLFPTHYQLSDDGVALSRLGRRHERGWDELRRVQVGSGAALVSPFARPNVLDRYRGLLLMFDGGDRDAIVAVLRDKIDASR